MSIFKKTKREFLRENQITGMFTKEQIKVLEKHDTDEDDYNSDSIFPWGSSNALKLFLVEKGDPYIKAQDIYAKKKRLEYAQRSFDKILKELNSISNKSDLDNWGKTFAQDYSRDTPEFVKELRLEFTRRKKELSNT
tara:strand:+ start:2783 stop:3193 length:411 start_codon:yes stop_codon:yes gene_type:complete